jgi:hypothetical protein
VITGTFELAVSALSIGNAATLDYVAAIAIKLRIMPQPGDARLGEMYTNRKDGLLDEPPDMHCQAFSFCSDRLAKERLKGGETSISRRILSSYVSDA